MFATSSAHASVAVLLEEPYGFLGQVSPSGHTAVYLDHICAETPVRVRPCAPGELGAVVSRYDDIGDRDWIAVPLLGYLYAVDRVDEIPQSITANGAVQARDAYRRSHLESFAADLPDGSAPGGNWYETAGSAFDRTIYGFTVSSTALQDLSLIAFLNDHPNVAHYNGAFANCADFVRTTVNHVFPHALRRNYVADFGLTSPKSVARGLAHYARRHPELQYSQFRVLQVPGNLPRSQTAVTLSEGIVRHFGIVLTALSPVAGGVVTMAYLTQGRFAEPRSAPLLNFDEIAAGSEANDAATNARASSALTRPPPD